MQEGKLGNTLGEIDSALHIGEEVIPLALGALSVFDPPAAGLAPVIGGLFQTIVKAVDAANQARGGGADLETTIANVVTALESGLGLAPGALGPNPPAG